MPEKSKFSAIIEGKCPRCRKGDMFQYGPFNYPKFTKTNADCAYCGLHYEIEPGFFYGGAMYVSYAFSVALFITVFVALNVLFDKPPLHWYLIVIVVSNVLLAPLMFRYSRVLFLHVFGGIKYDQKYDS